MKMRLWLGLVLVGIFCCGTDSLLPPAVHDGMKAAELSLDQQDSGATCAALSGLTNVLYEWQSFARGNQPALVESLLTGLESVTSECHMGNAADIDFDQLRQRYEHWAGETRKSTTRKSSATKWFLYLFGSLAIGGVLMYWRRKFREA